MISLFLWQWLTAFLTAGLSAPLIIWLYKKIGWVDDPSQNIHPKVVHTEPVPRGGGLVIAAGLIAVILLFIPLSSKLLGVLCGALILLVSGTLDDKYDIHPYIRYVLNIAAAMCVVIGGVGVDFVTNPFGQGVISLNQFLFTFTVLGREFSFSLIADTLALIWIVWNMNAVNWSKGVDGQLPGFVTLAALVIALLSLRFVGDTTQGVVTSLALGVSGAFAGLLVWNFYPQRMMPGYAAGSLAGYFLAVLAILAGAKIATALLVLAIPTVDGVFTIARRLAAGRSPFWGDRGHLHHRLLDAGWGKRRIALFYWLTTALFGSLALQLDSRGKFYVFLAAGILFLFLILWLKRSFSSSKPPDHASGSRT